MTARDQAIITNNPDATPYELHTQLGLSKKGFDELIARHDAETLSTLKASSVKTNTQFIAPAQPVLQPFHQSRNNSVFVRNKKSGLTTSLSVKAAKVLIRKSPNEFEIIQG